MCESAVICRQMIKTSIIWTVGRLSHFRFGEAYTQTVKAGAFEWKLTFYPKGLTDPEYARYAERVKIIYDGILDTKTFYFCSIYVTNVDCERERGNAVVQATLHVEFLGATEEASSSSAVKSAG